MFVLAADNPECILYSDDQWQIFLTYMLKSRLSNVIDTRRLETVRPAFPLTFETFVNTVQ